MWIYLELNWLGTGQTLHDGANRRVRVQLGLVYRHHRPELRVLRQLDRRFWGYKRCRCCNCDGDSGWGTTTRKNLYQFLQRIKEEGELLLFKTNKNGGTRILLNVAFLPYIVKLWRNIGDTTHNSEKKHLEMAVYNFRKI